MKTLITLGILLLASTLVHAQADKRATALKLHKDGNHKEALTIYKELLEKQNDDKSAVDLSYALDCLRALRLYGETDALLEKATTSHANNYQVLQDAAFAYQTLPHYGYIIAGTFTRGNHRGKAQYAQTIDRDRIRALQLILSAIDIAPKEAPSSAQASLHTQLAQVIFLGSSHTNAWRLQQLSDLTKLPDPAPGSRWGRGGRNPLGAPVTAENKPLFYKIPADWKQAKNDGERWRWALEQAAKHDPKNKDSHTLSWAGFLRSQFGVLTMRNFSWFSTMDASDQKGILQVHTLKENETLAKLATGVQRFTLAEGYDFVAIYKELSTRNSSAADTLISIYLDRRQHEKAAALLAKTIAAFPNETNRKHRKKLLHQINGNWGKLEPTQGSSPAGSEPSINYVFRNAKTVTITARPVDMDSMVNNLWKYLEGNPLKLKWQLVNLNNLANQLVNGTRKKYLGEEVARRTHELKPHPHHWDTRASLSLPIKKSGTYLISALLENGVTAHTVVYLDASVIVRKQVKGGEVIYLADAITGKPIADGKIEFFGYRQIRRKKPGLVRKYDVRTKRLNKTTGKDGSFFVKNGDFPQNHQWMLRAKSNKGVALLGFGSIGSNIRGDGSLNTRKTFGITDRPVYQPKQKVLGKFWVRQARYDLADVSTHAGSKFSVVINGPDHQDVLKKNNITADAYGGIEFSYDLPEDAKLGRYNIWFYQGKRRIGSHSFRVEEYKKPEFEVTVDAPKDGIMLGEKFQATVKANYYHGAPVTEAKVKIKVLRTRHNDRWFPVGRWDWLYGGGYGWFDIERPWYPGWSTWGCRCPLPFWWGRGGEQPEIVLEQELDISPDGTAKVEIDSALAKAVHSDTDHRYEITAEVVEASRRTILGKGSIIAARKAFNVSVWLDRGYSRVGDPLNATIATRTVDGKKLITKGKLTLFRIATTDGEVKETEVKSWDINTTIEANGAQKLQAGQAGQYRLAAKMTDAKGRNIEGAVLFTVIGDANAGVADGGFQYSDIELIADKRTYAKGEKVKLLINTKRPNSIVLISLRGGTEHQFIHIEGQSKEIEIPVAQKDMPNFFIEAATVSNAKVHTAVREIIVPPEKRILNVEVLPSGNKFKPRAQGKVKVRITDQHGEPVKGSLALTIYDKSLEYISGGSNVAAIQPHYWKWRRYFRGGFSDSFAHYERNTLKKNSEHMRPLGAFGHTTANHAYSGLGGAGSARGLRSGDFALTEGARSKNSAHPMAVPKVAIESPFLRLGRKLDSDFGDGWGGEGNAANAPAVMIRKDFADLVKWIGSVETNDNGIAEVPVTFPDNLTTWKIKTWAMAHGTRVGEGSAEVITSKDLIIRLQAPRFFVEKDEVVLSAVVHNYLKTDQEATISLELEGGTITSTSPLEQKQTIKAGGETRIDWRTKVTQEGTAIVRMKVITPDDSDAMEMTFPVYVHGILKQEAWSKVIEPKDGQASITINVPAQRRPEQTRLEIRYSPTIAGSIIDALPYLVEYPYGCTEQTLNRFVPTVIAQKLIREMGVKLEDVRNKRANLNPQEIGDDKTRMAQWKRSQRNPVFSEKEVNNMTVSGIKKLRQMQLADGGWGWFSGWGERSYPHTTAVVVHGLIIAKNNGAKIPENMLKRGVAWLKTYETREATKIRLWEKDIKRKIHTKQYASATDAFVRLVLAEAKTGNKEMLGYLFRDKNHHSVYAKSLTGMALHLAEETAKRDAVIRNIEQFLVHDDENQTAYLNLGNGAYWWHWYGSEMEAHAWYLKLLAATNPKSKQARGLVKYLVNNRKHATYWNSTRDTAYCIEAIADYMRASGENNPNAEVTVSVDGKQIKTVKITKENLFSYDNKVVIAGDALGTGEHKIDIVRKALGKEKGPLYTNAYLTVFTKEDFIKKAGLEVKVERAYYKLERIDAKESTAGTRGQVIDHKVEKYKRIPLKSGAMLESGDLVEVELHIHSKNDYEYLMFNDWKPAGLEAVKIRSGYTRNGMRAYMEMHHEKTSFFVRQLPRGSHSLKYRLRAEIPGTFSALPAMAEAMYAPELKANSNEMKIQVKDKQ